jgi:N-acetyl-anhydromuramyl-L-alanine amidase AmpD
MRAFANTNQCKKIILHCSATDHDHHDNIDAIDEIHKKMGFLSCGYHYFIRKNGTIEIGRQEDEIGAHCRWHNDSSIGICFSGLDEKKFTKQQFFSASKLIINLMYRYNLTQNQVVGHNQLNSHKSCPVFNVKKFKNKYLP